MKIIKLTAENIKRIKAVEITPDKAVVQITGPNNSGKSSVLDAIYYALAGAASLPSQPVREGEEKAFVKLDLGELVVTRRFTAAGGTSLVVEAANGARFPSPQAMLDALLGKLTFDPLAFSRATPAQQLETLRRLVPLSVNVNQIDLDNTRDAMERTDANRVIRRLEAELAGLSVSTDLPEHPVDVSNLLNQIDDVNKANQNRQKLENELKAERTRVGQQRKEANDLREKAVDKRNYLREDAKEHRDAIVRLREQISDLEKQVLRRAERAQEADRVADEIYAASVSTAEALEKEANRVEKELDATVIPNVDDPASLYEQVKQAERINQGIKQRERQQKLIVEINTRKQEVEELFTRRIEARTAEKVKAIAEAKMPVPGLAFGNGEVLYQGIPLAQASASERLRISVAIAMAANPKLRVLRIEDGSLLDEAGMKLLQKMAETNDYQVWIERVDESGRVGVIMEDGAVRGRLDN